MTRRHYTEDRPCRGSMGIQRRIVSAKLQGPWVHGTNTTAAWKAYKAARKRQDAGQTTRPVSPSHPPTPTPL